MAGKVYLLSIQTKRLTNYDLYNRLAHIRNFLGTIYMYSNAVINILEHQNREFCFHKLSLKNSTPGFMSSFTRSKTWYFLQFKHS